MSIYLIQLKQKEETFFGYRNKKGEWSAVTNTCFATKFKTEKGAWRAIERGDDLLLSAYGSACWHDLLQKKGYSINVVNINVDVDLNVDVAPPGVFH